MLVLNVGGYTGPSTRSEIAYAAAHGKPVRYLEPPTRPEPATSCGHGHDYCPTCADRTWACLHCGDAFFGTPPDDGLCPGCRAAEEQ